MRRIAKLGGLLAVAGWSCSAAPPPDPRIEAAREYAREVTGDDLKSSMGGLLVTIDSASVDGRYLRIAGRVANRYPEKVEGIHYLVQMIVPGNPPRVADTICREVGTTLDAGEDRILRMEIENPIHATGPGFVDIEATPVSLGGKAMEPFPECQ